MTFFDRALASYYITPLSVQMGSKMRTFVYEYIFRSVFRWLHGWTNSLGLSSNSLGPSNSLGLSRSLGSSKSLGLSRSSSSIR